MKLEKEDGKWVEKKSRPHHSNGRRRRLNRKCMEKRVRPKKKGGKG